MTQLSPSGRRLDRYVLLDEIASGGMATVHFGRLLGSAGFARTVAIKRLHPMFAKAPEFVEMFTDEARLAARMRHPNIAATLDVVSVAGELFLVMEYIQGESVARLLRLTAQRKENVPVPIAAAIAVGTLMGLHAAHEATTESGESLGVVHRDVSPQNIMVGSDGVPRVLDFGVAKAVGRLQTTRDGEMKGKTAYMAPEQLSGREIDRRVDVYAASVVLWEVLTGHRLFVADTTAATLAQVLQAEVEPPSRYAPVPAELDALVLRGLSRDRDRRFATALEMASALERTVLLPTAREVGAWLQSVAAESLASRHVILRRIESAGVEAGQPLDAFAAPREPLIVPAQATSVMVAGTTARGPRGRRRPTWLIVPAAVVGGAAAVLAGANLTRGPTLVAPSTASPVASSTPVERSSPEPIASAGSSGPTLAGAAPSAAAPSGAASSGAAPSGAAPSTRARSSSGHESSRPAAPRRAPARAPARSCDPPYVIDQDGIHIPKPECG